MIYAIFGLCITEVMLTCVIIYALLAKRPVLNIEKPILNIEKSEPEKNRGVVWLDDNHEGRIAQRMEYDE